MTGEMFVNSSQTISKDQRTDILQYAWYGRPASCMSKLHIVHWVFELLGITVQINKAI